MYRYYISIPKTKGCKMAIKLSDEEIRKIVEIDTNYEYSVLWIEKIGKKNPETGKRMSRRMSLKHNECEHIYEINISGFLQGKRRCGQCKGKVLREHNAYDIETIKLKTQELTKGEYSFVDEHYTNSKTEHKFLHHSCGTIFKKKWNKFKGNTKQPGQRCTKCYRKGMESGASRFVRDVLDHLYISYDCEKRFKDCINPGTGMILPFDYYLPESNTLIEIDGEQHARASFSKYASEGIMERDKIKNRYAKEKGIELVRIPAKKWSQLPEFLHDIIARDLRPTLTLKEVKSIAQSSHPERINKDLKKVHNGEYKLYDPYYFGVDREHNFEHIPCGHIFTATLYQVKIRKDPCINCKKTARKDAHDKTSRRFMEKSNGRYSLDPSQIGVDKKFRRLTRCHWCNKSWWVTPNNLMLNKANCPNCLKIQNEQDWTEKLNAYKTTIQKVEELSKAQDRWIAHNKSKYKNGSLKESRMKLLQEAGIL